MTIEPSSTVHVVARHFAKPGKVSDVRDILERLIPLSRAEAGCLKYELFQNTSDPADFTFLETFASDAALAIHAAAPYIVNLPAQMAGLIAQPPEVRVYRQVSNEVPDGQADDPRG